VHEKSFLLLIVLSFSLIIYPKVTNLLIKITTMAEDDDLPLLGLLRRRKTVADENARQRPVDVTGPVAVGGRQQPEPLRPIHQGDPSTTTENTPQSSSSSTTAAAVWRPPRLYGTLSVFVAVLAIVTNTLSNTSTVFFELTPNRECEMIEKKTDFKRATTSAIRDASANLYYYYSYYYSQKHKNNIEWWLDAVVPENTEKRFQQGGHLVFLRRCQIKSVR